jgi:hypothetical protein
MEELKKELSSKKDIDCHANAMDDPSATIVVVSTC